MHIKAARDHKACVQSNLNRPADLRPDEMLIEQGGTDNDIHLVLSGSLNIVVNGRIVARRVPGDHVGEMAAIEPTQRRAASVIAIEETVVATISEPDLAELGAKYPEIYRCLAKELSRRFPFPAFLARVGLPAPAGPLLSHPDASLGTRVPDTVPAACAPGRRLSKRYW
jgi:hypothetical protein